MVSLGLLELKTTTWFFTPADTRSVNSVLSCELAWLAHLNISLNAKREQDCVVCAGIKVSHVMYHVDKYSSAE